MKCGPAHQKDAQGRHTQEHLGPETVPADDRAQGQRDNEEPQAPCSTGAISPQLLSLECISGPLHSMVLRAPATVHDERHTLRGGGCITLQSCHFPCLNAMSISAR